jgi:prepilin-type N-terminal cleavage/methylation domain-containing protein
MMIMNVARVPGARASCRTRGAAARASCPCGGGSTATSPCHGVRSRGFTLIELLVVILIILIVSAVALPTVLPALSHRQVSEAARILQGALVGARDSAIKNNSPSGIRLLPDPAFPIQYTTINGSTQIDATQPLAANRIIPIAPAPDYSEGFLAVLPNVLPNGSGLSFTSTTGLNYPVQNVGGTTSTYPYNLLASNITNGNVLMVAEQVISTSASTNGLPNAPTSWFWNIRVGDKIQINNAGPWYTVVGPMSVTPATGNNELFVNVGAPGVISPLQSALGATTVNPEFLFLVNGQDDNTNGYVDEGWDGVDNNGNGIVDDLFEYEVEAWHGALAAELMSSPTGVGNLAYTIQRRPAPTTNAREVLLPTNVVVDMTTWGFPTTTLAGPSRERSRLPVNQFTGYVDILVNTNGSVVPTTIYSAPTSFGMSSSFFHFWLAERSDVFTPMANSVNANAPPYLPLPPLGQLFDPQGLIPTLFSGAEIKGEYRLVTLFTRTGQITTNEEVPFDNTSNISGGTFNTGVPFLQAQQGVRGGN